MERKYTIILADDHSILRAGLRAMLTGQPEFDVVAEVGNGKEAIYSAVHLKPDLLITDLSMPKTNGTEAIREIKRRNPDIKILVLTMHATEEHVHNALSAGADGYVLKEDSRDELLTAIKNVLVGKNYLSPGICGNVVNGYLGGIKPATTSSLDTLTHREREIIKLIAEGYRNKQIAEYLNISIKTVEKHRSNLMKKLDLHSISALTNYAIQHQIISN